MKCDREDAPSSRGLAWAAAILIVLALAAGRADAREIRGKVTNGTTGKPVALAKVVIVDPRHGMATENEIQTDAQGNFAAPNVDDKITMFLLQVTYEGVTYTEIFKPEGESAETTIEVYDTTPAWDDVRVSLPHLMARRSNDTLSVDRIFFVTNKSAPPKTVTGEGAGFRLYIPENRLQITSLFVNSIGVPIPVTPHPTNTAGVYTIDYPFKPGDTQLGVSFDVAYPESGYTYVEPLQYALDEAVVMTEDSTMELTSPTLDLGKLEEVRGFRAHRLTSLPRAAALALRFRGGEAKFGRAAPDRQESGETGSDTGHEIVTLRNLGVSATVALIAGFTLLLVLVLSYAAKSPLVGEDDIASLARYRGSLLNSVARLDDLIEVATIPEQFYRETRADLVERLSRITYHIERFGPKKSRADRERKGTPPKGTSRRDSQ
jgi:hypothetical protein